VWKYNCLLYGVRDFPESNGKCFTGITGVVVYLDDILISGCDTTENLKRLDGVLQKLQDAGD